MPEQTVETIVITPIGVTNKVREISVSRHHGGAFGLSMTHRVDLDAANDWRPDVGPCFKSTVYMTVEQRRALAAALLTGVPREDVHLAEAFPASTESVDQVVEASQGADGRSAWTWLRIANGDLMLGLFPQGYLYERVEHLVADDLAQSNPSEIRQLTVEADNG